MIRTLVCAVRTAIIRSGPGFVLVLLFLLSCGGPNADSLLRQQLADALTLHASFDVTVDADYGRGDTRIYTRAGRADPTLGADAAVLTVEMHAGKFGGALRFLKAVRSKTFYPVRDYVAYTPDAAWGGSVSYWLNTNPNTELTTKFCDPIQILQRKFNDAAIWQDFSDDTPRNIRVGFFPDGPDDVNTRDVPDSEKPWTIHVNPDWRKGDWHHVVLTWRNLNSGLANGAGVVYFDGQQTGEISGWDLRFTWNLPQVQINLGVNYVGLMDDLAMFNRALTTEEVQALNRLPHGVADLR